MSGRPGKAPRNGRSASGTSVDIPMPETFASPPPSLAVQLVADDGTLIHDEELLPHAASFAIPRKPSRHGEDARPRAFSAAEPRAISTRVDSRASQATWFRPHFSATDCTTELRNKADGAFVIVNNPAASGAFILVYVFGGSTHAVDISDSAEGLRLSDSSRRFQCLSDLVTYYAFASHTGILRCTLHATYSASKSSGPHTSNNASSAYRDGRRLFSESLGLRPLSQQFERHPPAADDTSADHTYMPMSLVPQDPEFSTSWKDSSTLNGRGHSLSRPDDRPEPPSSPRPSHLHPRRAASSGGSPSLRVSDQIDMKVRSNSLNAPISTTTALLAQLTMDSIPDDAPQGVYEAIEVDDKSKRRLASVAKGQELLKRDHMFDDASKASAWNHVGQTREQALAVLPCSTWKGLWVQ